ncbi:PAS domain-containing sensor histidine kinase [Rhodococcus aerolatus]
MSTLSELLAVHTSLPGHAVEHLQRLVSEWQLLADLSFADFRMWVRPDEPGTDPGGALLCVAQARPTTSHTVFAEDEVGSRSDPGVDAHLREALELGEARTAPDVLLHEGVPLRRHALPVRCEGVVVAVLGRDVTTAQDRAASPLEVAYLECAGDLSQMVADGSFPPRESVTDVHSSPRAGDGLVRVDPSGTVLYASPNAVSAYHRMGLAVELVGTELAKVTRELVTDPFDAGEVVGRVRAALGGSPTPRVEADARGATVLLRALPLRPGGRPGGALVLVRDVTDVKRRDRALLSKDATIREIHHRVKNNLQTVAALLRLQARRTGNEETRGALSEAVRRVASIALVHDTLSMSVDERVDLDDVVDRLVPMMADVATVTSDIAVVRTGRIGVLAAELATPLVMVLTELVQNAIEHAYSAGERGTVQIRAERSAGALELVVADDGRGLPEGFSLARADRLGLQIVRTLVDAELRGTLGLHRGAERGTEAVLRVPLSGRYRQTR